jgi:hypothetical protein
VDHQYEKIERGMDADIAAHDTRMTRTKQDVSQWKSNALQPDAPIANGEMGVAARYQLMHAVGMLRTCHMLKRFRWCVPM